MTGPQCFSLMLHRPPPAKSSNCALGGVGEGRRARYAGNHSLPLVTLDDSSAISLVQALPALH